MANGMYTNSELIDTIIVDINNVLKDMMNGQFIDICFIVTSMTQKLTNLKKGIDTDLANKDKTIETLKQELRDAGCEIEEFTPDELFDQKKDGAE